MDEPTPAPLFFACCHEPLSMMRDAGMNDMAIATVLIGVRAAAISEERMRVEWLSKDNPPRAGIRPQDILAQITRS